MKVGQEGKWSVKGYLEVMLPQQAKEIQDLKLKTFHGGPVVKTSSSNAGGVGLIPGWVTKIPHAS